MKTILSEAQLALTVKRLAHQILENNLQLADTVLIGLQPRGIYLSDRIVAALHQELPADKVQYGKLDITFYRDDFRRSDKVLEANSTEIDFLIENKRVVFIDDVLYTGRSIRAALTAIQSFGRPSEIELLTLIDRRFSRHLPIQPDYRGRQVDAINDEKVLVNWKESSGEDAVYLIKN